MSFVRFLARPMLASSFVLAGMDKLKNADDTATQLVPLAAPRRRMPCRSRPMRRSWPA